MAFRIQGQPRLGFLSGSGMVSDPAFWFLVWSVAMDEDTKFKVACWCFDTCIIGIYAVAFCMIAEVISAIW